MISLKRYGSAVAGAAMLATLALGMAPAALAAAPSPAVVAHKAVTGPIHDDCAALTAQLNAQLQAAQDALAAVPPNVAAAQSAISAAQATVKQLQAERCLPSTPPTPPSCATLKALLAQNIQALNAALSTVPPDLTAVNAALKALLKTLDALEDAGCLPLR